MRDLPQEKQAAFATALEKRGRSTWDELTGSGRHTLGYESVSKSAIIPGIPEELRDRDRFMVFRYHAKRPMVGFRTTDTFHVVWIEREFGEVYPHS